MLKCFQKLPILFLILSHYASKFDLWFQHLSLKKGKFNIHYIATWCWLLHSLQEHFLLSEESTVNTLTSVEAILSTWHDGKKMIQLTVKACTTLYM